MNDRLSEIERRVAAVLPTPWKLYGDVILDAYGDDVVNVADLTDTAWFIAHAPDDVRWLVARVRELEAERAKIAAELRAFVFVSQRSAENLGLISEALGIPVEEWSGDADDLVEAANLLRSDAARAAAPQREEGA